MPFAPQHAQLAGRDRPLAILEAVIADARSRRRGLALVVGDPGMGKTALVREALAGEDVVVLWGSGAEDESQVAYGLIEQMIRASPLSHDEADHLRMAMGPDPVTTGIALVGLVDRLDLDPARPLIVVVDDAHWADAASLAALTFAARRLQRDPAALVITSRTDRAAELPEGLQRLVADQGQVVELEPLSRSDVRRLVESRFGRDLGARAAERLLVHTEGLPLHVHAVLDGLDAEDLTSDRLLPAPRSLATLVLSRLAGSPAETEALVSTAAVIGATAVLSDAAAVAGLDDPWPAVDDAVARGLLRVSTRADGATTIEVAHPLMRAAIVSDLAPGRRAQIHRGAAEVSTGATSLRHLLLGAVGPEPELWRTTLDRIRAARSEGQWSVGAHLAALAIKVAPGQDERDRTVLVAADMEIEAGLLDAAGARRSVIEQQPASAHRSFLLGRLAYVVGPRADAAAHLADAWTRVLADAGGDDALAGAGTELRALAGAIAAMQATVAVDLGQGELGVERARRALALDPVEAARAGTAHLLAGAYALTGDLDGGLTVLEELCSGVGQRDRAVLADAHSGRGLLRMWCHDLSGAADDLEISLGRGAATTFVVRETTRYYLAEVRYRQGRWDDAILLAETAASLVDDSDQVWMAAIPHATAARPLAARGIAAGRVHIDVARAAAEKVGGVSRVLTAASGLEVAASERSMEEVVSLGDWLAGRATDERLVPWRATYVEGLAATGQQDRAAAVLEALAGNARTPAVEADLARARAALAVAGETPDLEPAEAAARALDPSEVGPFGMARLELVLGQARRRHGERRRAAAWLESARSRFLSLGAEPWLAVAEREIEACGLRPARRRPSGNRELTPTERMVAELVMRGMTNREVARELVISAKTVEHHLSHIYAKVGAKSRSELPAALNVTGDTP